MCNKKITKSSQIHYSFINSTRIKQALRYRQKKKNKNHVKNELKIHSEVNEIIPAHFSSDEKRGKKKKIKKGKKKRVAFLFEPRIKLANTASESKTKRRGNWKEAGKCEESPSTFPLTRHRMYTSRSRWFISSWTEDLEDLEMPGYCSDSVRPCVQLARILVPTYIVSNMILSLSRCIHVYIP